MAAPLVVCRAVLDALGGPDEARAMLDTKLKPGEYRCTACGQLGQWGSAEPAVIVVHLWLGVTLVRLAHPGCSKSQVVRGQPRLFHDRGEFIRGLVRTKPNGIEPVLLIGPLSALTTKSEQGEMVDQWTHGLMADGFHLVTDLDAPIPPLPGLVVHRGRDGVAVELGGVSVFEGDPVNDPAWDEYAAALETVVVVCATGLRLDNPHRDPMADLFTAIGHGFVVGATARYMTTTGARSGSTVDAPPRPARSWRRGWRRR